MIFDVGEDKTYLQYLIFYESLSEQYKKAYDLYNVVQEKLDEMKFDEENIRGSFTEEEQNEPMTPNPDIDPSLLSSVLNDARKESNDRNQNQEMI